MRDRVLNIPSIPKGEYYEDAISSILALGHYFLERRITRENILELDIVTTSFSSNGSSNILVEIKSGDWGFPDVFKIRGWMDYLAYDQALFVSQNSKKEAIEIKVGVAQRLSINIVDIPKGNNERLDYSSFEEKYTGRILVSDKDVCAKTCLSFSFCLERVLLDKYLKALTKDPKCLLGIKQVRNFVEEVLYQSFFIPDSHKRIQNVFESFSRNHNITARVDYERTNNCLPVDEVKFLSSGAFRELYYSIPAQKNPLHLALFSELLCRLTILKLCVEEVQRDKTLTGFMKSLMHIQLPTNLSNAVLSLAKHPYYTYYPHFWQLFIYLFGGFILLDRKEKEYELLSYYTGIPVDHIDDALGAFDLLFPIENGKWFIDKPNTCIRTMNFFPIPFAGIGVNFRRIIYRTSNEKDKVTDIQPALSGKYTVANLVKYHELAYKYLEGETELHFCAK